MTDFESTLRLSGSVRHARRWKRRPLLQQRVNARWRLIRPEPRLMPPSNRKCQRLSKPI
jgi:hypothetical protein